MVLDRPNPIGGSAWKAPSSTREAVLVGYHRLPIRHGMTVGELARCSTRNPIGADLAARSRDGGADWFEETGLA